MNKNIGRPSVDSRESPNRYSKAEVKAQAIVEIETMIKGGTKVRAAVEEVAYRSGFSERSLFTYLAKTKGISLDEREAALARKPMKPRPKVICHPDALKRFIDLCRSGGSVSAGYRQVECEAADKGWGDLPSERTLRRELDRQVSWSERWVARRAIQPQIGGAANV